MIQQKEFMTGNIVLIPSLDNEYYEVCQINRYGKDCIVTNHKLGVKSNVLNIEDFEPVVLTEEILLNCGFEVIGHTAEKAGVELWNKSKGVYDYRWSVNGQYRGTRLRYLHQLQNLYFALTQTELKITLN